MIILIGMEMEEDFLVIMGSGHTRDFQTQMVSNIEDTMHRPGEVNTPLQRSGTPVIIEDTPTIQVVTNNQIRNKGVVTPTTSLLK